MQARKVDGSLVGPFRAGGASAQFFREFGPQLLLRLTVVISNVLLFLSLCLTQPVVAATVLVGNFTVDQLGACSLFVVLLCSALSVRLYLREHIQQRAIDETFPEESKQHMRRKKKSTRQHSSRHICLLLIQDGFSLVFSGILIYIQRQEVSSVIGVNFALTLLGFTYMFVKHLADLVMSNKIVQDDARVSASIEGTGSREDLQEGDDSLEGNNVDRVEGGSDRERRESMALGGLRPPPVFRQKDRTRFCSKVQKENRKDLWGAVGSFSVAGAGMLYLVLLVGPAWWLVAIPPVGMAFGGLFVWLLMRSGEILKGERGDFDAALKDLKRIDEMRRAGKKTLMWAAAFVLPLFVLSISLSIWYPFFLSPGSSPAPLPVDVWDIQRHPTRMLRMRGREVIRGRQETGNTVRGESKAAAPSFVDWEALVLFCGGVSLLFVLVACCRRFGTESAPPLPLFSTSALSRVSIANLEEVCQPPPLPKRKKPNSLDRPPSPWKSPTQRQRQRMGHRSLSEGDLSLLGSPRDPERKSAGLRALLQSYKVEARDLSAERERKPGPTTFFPSPFTPLPSPPPTLGFHPNPFFLMPSLPPPDRIEVPFAPVGADGRERLRQFRPPPTPLSSNCSLRPPGSVPVFLMVYDLDDNFSNTNERLKKMQLGGVIHVGVEVGESEFFFGHEVGVGSVRRGEFKSSHVYKYKVDLGYTFASEDEIKVILDDMHREGWHRFNYRLLHNNCQHFAVEFIRRLREACPSVRPVPPEFLRLARGFGGLDSVLLGRLSRWVDAKRKRPENAAALLQRHIELPSFRFWRGLNERVAEEKEKRAEKERRMVEQERAQEYYQTLVAVARERGMTTLDILKEEREAERWEREMMEQEDSMRGVTSASDLFEESDGFVDLEKGFSPDFSSWWQ
uniref:PPPDE domain-containing protein n=1 Tax=Chromera velia CCMP2878 TaxID=1169474 RepID=A0A0G4HEC5_9ALVE|eukprot:Cvel_26583.t1-p1 / transcript=Cvel_26583.t1 / gene=Cvel_26583 / organism=Chromera_velia_CCMP2878 / gene_product=hypothetical protein / transcript_product=hypothetical protein / location=Cvel_scaffold3183:6454-9520(-) / protein_length=904 / sequence_SO=supercontig / SO=protein_coding / is_pseudo=false